MRFICFLILTIAVLAQAENPKDKRLAIDPDTGYHQGSVYSHQPTQRDYLTAQTQQQQQQQYYQSEGQQPQTITYTQPIQKYATAGAAPAQKYTFSHQPKQQIPYSSAADVSSFSYSSPIVSYNNLGLLKQLAGHAASSQDVPVSYNTDQSAKSEYSSQPKVQYISAPKVQYTSSPVQYTASPKLQYSSAAKSQGASPSGAYTANAAPNYEEIYQQIAQKAAYAAAEQQQQQQSQQHQQPIYRQSAPQKLVYQQSASPVVYQFQKSAGAAPTQEETYSSAPSQQYSFQLPQEYESAAQSSPQAYLSQSTHTSAQAPQYYTLGTQGHGKAGVTYSS